ncbi:peptidase inhibitor family I36 protein [Streptomyces sp. SP18CS02]|uniref:peptidase inhibitor family I36 protein n=1 Tax=Streptomyces sp. SP18CS02 TaxID=3002531 RepID=UPI002E75F721|nr:peptidase inhibitor family I36 protein [Streptomyces sp. SP18CS02]MEE1753318.1 peptidase inhibitor family I36 protein [Streptomyces sp. SP18CS02]
MRIRTVLTTAAGVATTAALAATALTPGAFATAAGPGAAAAPRPGTAAAPARLGPCDVGQLCLWDKEDFKGIRRTYELTAIDIESCVPLPRGTAATALANRTGRPVTTYQSAECAETGEFDTYPGGGTWVPQSPYRARAFKVWEN